MIAYPLFLMFFFVCAKIVLTIISTIVGAMGKPATPHLDLHCIIVEVGSWIAGLLALGIFLANPMSNMNWFFK